MNENFCAIHLLMCREFVMYIRKYLRQTVYSQLLQGRTFIFEIPSLILLTIMSSDASCSTV